MATTQLADVVESTAIRPFQVNVPEADLIDLRRRIVATRLPEKETVGDFTQGVPLATVQKLARYWAADYDWRKVEARLNAVPNFITEIDGLDIHFSLSGDEWLFPSRTGPRSTPTRTTICRPMNIGRPQPGRGSTATTMAGSIRTNGLGGLCREVSASDPVRTLASAGWEATGEDCQLRFERAPEG